MRMAATYTNNNQHFSQITSIKRILPILRANMWFSYENRAIYTITLCVVWCVCVILCWNCLLFLSVSFSLIVVFQLVPFRYWFYFDSKHNFLLHLLCTLHVLVQPLARVKYSCARWNIEDDQMFFSFITHLLFHASTCSFFVLFLLYNFVRHRHRLPLLQ